MELKEKLKRWNSQYVLDKPYWKSQFLENRTIVNWIKGNAETFGIYDTEENCFISLQPINSRKEKLRWEKPHHASLAFNNAFGFSMKEQSRFEVRNFDMNR